MSIMLTLNRLTLLSNLQTGPKMNHRQEMWMVGIMVSVTVVKFVLMIYCRRFKNEIVRAYAQDHFFDVVTNSIGLATAVLAIRFYWWIDPTGAIIVSAWKSKYILVVKQLKLVIFDLTRQYHPCLVHNDWDSTNLQQTQATRFHFVWILFIMLWN